MIERKTLAAGMKYSLIFLALAALMVSAPAFAQVNTAEEGLTNVQDWMQEWIPILATLAIIVSAVAWMSGFMRMDIAVRIVVGLIVIGSASYIVGFFL
ncbi:MAG: TrbC/VirB2 family protein [Pseudomonadota bacterium]